jgi:uncharacterized protein YgiM (DUF1202 family)
MKKTICLAILLCTILSGFSMATASGFGTYESNGKTFAVVNNPNPADRLHLRTQPRTGATSLGKYYNGVTVEVLSYPSDTWVEVRIGNTVGYMLKQYLTASGVASASPTVTVNNPNSADRLNLRTAMSETSESLGKYHNGTQVVVLGVGTTWHHVAVDGKKGYMMAKYLTPVDSGGNTAGSSTVGSSGSWGGPVGSHQVSGWPISPNDYSTAVAIINNPNAADRLHLRAEPRDDAKSLGKYYNGVRLANAGIPDGVVWIPVSIGKLTGYMKAQYLMLADTPGHSLSSVMSAMPIMEVSNPNTAANLQLREKPSTISGSLGVYPNGTKVVLMGFSDEWAHVIVDGKMGFMMGIYLK